MLMSIRPASVQAASGVAQQDTMTCYLFGYPVCVLGGSLEACQGGVPRTVALPYWMKLCSSEMAIARKLQDGC